MKSLLPIFLLISNFLFAQQSEKLFFGRFHNYSTVYSYGVTEISISKDSIFTRYDYKLPNKKEWKKYKNYQPRKERLRISKRGEYYVFVDSLSGEEIFEMHRLKITRKKLTYYFKDSNGDLTKGFTFKK